MSARRLPRIRPGLRVFWTALACAASLALAEPAAWAQSPEDEARAETLFHQGRALMMEPGKLDEACSTLEESFRLHDRGDTLLNLAECHARQGKTATAWAEFDRAIEHGAKVKFEEAMTVARARRDELAQVLSTLTITVPDQVAALEGLVIELNGAPLPKDGWNQPAIRDPGTFEVVARAKGYRRLVLRVALGAQKDTRTLVVALEKEPPPVVAAPPPKPPPPPEKASLPVWPFVVGGGGLALLGVSAGFGIASAGAGSDLDEACGDDRSRCPESRRTDLESTRSTELTTFGAFVGLGAGGILALGVAGVGLGLGLGQTDASSTTTAITVGLGSMTLRRSFH